MLTNFQSQHMLTSMSSPTSLIATATDDDPREGLHAVAALRRLVEQLERAHVARARSTGWSWQEIALALGVSKQTVHRKHRHTR